MIGQCDNEECKKWAKMAEPIFENMGIDLSKIFISIHIRNNENDILKNASGKAVKPNFIYIKNNLLFDNFIQTYAHEVGHITQNFGLCGNPKNLITKFIADSIALKFEKEFLIKFNNKYGTNIPIDTAFITFINRMADCYGKHLVILKTKSEYKSIKK